MGLKKDKIAWSSASIDLEAVSKSYGRFRALDNVSLSIRPGEFLTLLGPSGSGKTTLLMIIAGFVRADSGSLRFGDLEVIDLPPHKRGVGMVFQSYALFPHMSVAQNVAYPLRVRNVDKDEMQRRVREALQIVQLQDLGDRKPSELSGGQRQRVALARSIVFEPRILIMDEPLSALDQNLREAMQLEIRRLHDRLGVTTVYVTHDQREALTMSDRIVVMSSGRIEQVGSPREIYNEPSTSFVGAFVGESYLLPLDLRDSVPSLFARPLVAERHPIYSPSETYELLIRPERLRLGGRTTSAANVFATQLRGMVYQGDTVMVNMSMTNGVEVGLRLRANDPWLRDPPAPGSPMTVTLAAEDAIVVRSGRPGT